MKLSSSDRKSLIKLASSLPKGSKERRAILAGLKKVARFDRNRKYDLYLRRGRGFRAEDAVMEGKKINDIERYVQGQLSDYADEQNPFHLVEAGNDPNDDEVWTFNLEDAIDAGGRGPFDWE